MKLSEFGFGVVEETIETGGGSAEEQARTGFGGDEKAVREQLEKYVKGTFLAKSIGNFEITRREDFSGPFRIRVEAKQAKVAETESEDAGAVLMPWLIFE